VPLRQQHAVDSRGLARAQDRAEVARVLDAVEHHQQCRIAQRLEHGLERVHRLCGDDRDHSLMRYSAGHPVQGLARLES